MVLFRVEAENDERPPDAANSSSSTIPRSLPPAYELQTPDANPPRLFCYNVILSFKLSCIYRFEDNDTSLAPSRVDDETEMQDANPRESSPRFVQFEII